jgi:transcription-repair coupling factor (superfamily II helicase)
VTQLVGEGYSVTLCAATDGRGGPAVGGAGRGGGPRAGGRRAAARQPGAGRRGAALSTGFILPDCKVAVLSESDITGRRMPHRRARPGPAPPTASSTTSSGSFVVHRQHGVARFEGVTSRTMGGTTRDYLILQYRGSDRLYLPGGPDRGDHPVQRRRDPDALEDGRADWQRTRAKARAAAGEVAEELVELYRRRWPSRACLRSGHAVADRDGGVVRLRRDRGPAEGHRRREGRHGRAPADGPAGLRRRGFGKTEVAVRAVFKAVQDGKQAAVLAPTTLLASQHAQTFADRFAPYPVRVELLSRFLSPAQQRKVIEGWPTAASTW